MVDRSIQAWNSLNFVGQNKDEEFEFHISHLRSMNSLDDVLSKREFWFFQLRESFMKQKVMNR
jgi:hypothetical protein